ncbi:MAG: S8 family serine peptidase, partial [Verrucomicrobia bacterium]|nr:S8 family serine peptidase [Verrucomicrobiota bacterium]
MRTRSGILALVCGCLTAHAAGKAVSSVPDEVPVILLLEGEPLAGDDAVSTAAASAAPAAGFRRESLRRQQAGLESHLQNLGGRVTDRFDTLLNALVVRLPASRLAEARRLPGVRAVRRARNFQPLLSTSVPFIGAPAAWELAGGGRTGRGMRIGIIDSGVDYLHAHFGGAGDPDAFAANDSRRIEPGTFPTAKVTGGHDFVGDDFDADGSVGSTTPVEDPDPLDPAANGHGTHVAGIAAGFGVLTNGATYAGPYRKGLDPAAFLIGPGVAPEASVHAYKVFGRGGTTSFAIIVRALERCLDPNQDGRFDDHLDVVNLSLGIPFGLADASEPEIEAVNRLSRRGVVVVVAAGN